MKRQKNYKPYLYCKSKRQQVTWQDCKSCSMRQLRPIAKIKNKTSKQIRIEKNRFSIIQSDMSICFFCGKQAESTHELIGGINRQMSMKYGLCVGACLKCHRELEDNNSIKEKWQKYGQKMFEKKYSHELFMEVFRRNYL